MGIWIRLKFRKHCSRKLPVLNRYDIEKLENENIHKNYISKISENLKEQQIANTDEANNVWNQIRDTI